MPFKHNSAHRHRIGKMKFKATNWAEYEAGLRRRGSLTLWITPEALLSWQASKRTTRGGQPCYSDLAIETALTLGVVFGLHLRQTEGLLASVLNLMGLDLAVPDHTTLSRRARTWRSMNRPNGRSIAKAGPVHVLIDSTGLEVYGAGQWQAEKHGAKSRRRWCKLHLALDADTGEIIAQTMTGQDAGDPHRSSRYSIRSIDRLASLRPTAPMMVNRPMMLSAGIAPMLSSSFHLGPMRSTTEMQRLSVSETGTAMASAR